MGLVLALLLLADPPVSRALTLPTVKPPSVNIPPAVPAPPVKLPPVQVPSVSTPSLNAPAASKPSAPTHVSGTFAPSGPSTALGGELSRAASDLSTRAVTGSVNANGNLSAIAAAER